LATGGACHRFCVKQRIYNDSTSLVRSGATREHYLLIHRRYKTKRCRVCRGSAHIAAQPTTPVAARYVHHSRSCSLPASGNRVAEVGPVISSFTSLLFLDLSRNKLERISTQALKLREDCYIDLLENPHLMCPPKVPRATMKRTHCLVAPIPPE
jgi:hypothetical protein